MIVLQPKGGKQKVENSVALLAGMREHSIGEGASTPPQLSVTLVPVAVTSVCRLWIHDKPTEG
jgi:hypothetical protein